VTPEEFIYIYLEVLNNNIWQSQKNMLEKNSYVTKLISDHIKNHKSAWIKDELPNAGYVLIAPKVNFAKHEYQPSPGVLLVLGATFATAGAASFLFFKNAKDTAKHELEKRQLKTLVV
jgi:hypothetical protein